MKGIGDVDTLKRFYELMSQTRDVRAGLVRSYLASDTADAEGVDLLREALDRLLAIPQGESGRRVSLDGEKTIDLDLGYEVGELERDILFLTRGEEAFRDHLACLHPGFDEHLARGREALAGISFNCFVTDRDGTVCNYCGRYRSSIQPVYNAVFLARFARRRTRHAILITSAPMSAPGVLDVATDPDGTFIRAASKGREFVDAEGGRHAFPIDPSRQAVLDSLNERLSSLVRQPAYEKFALIGSGLQFKFGQTTVSRQDVTHSIPEEESRAFLDLVRDTVRELDREGKYFAMEDTGLDVEVMLTVTGGPSRSVPGRDFDKGDGILFMDSELGLGLERGPHLVCGDTPSDLRMLVTCLEKTPEVKAAFVARSEEFAQRVREMAPGAVILPETDVLVALLDELSMSGGA